MVSYINFNSTTDTKLRWFQYRLVNRILNTNTFLYMIGRSENDACEFCYKEKESLIHLFCDCKVICSFWEGVMSWIHSKLNITIHLNTLTIIFGFRNKLLFLENCILIYIKYYIYIKSNV